MQIFKTIPLILTLIFSQASYAGDWRAVLSRAGFFGKVAVGASYEPSLRHAVDLSIGLYHIGDERYAQSNFAYRYSRWQIEVGPDQWRPLQFGFFLVHATGNDRYFLQSPNVYPEGDYYDPTAVRYGLEVGSTYTWLPNRIGLSYHLRIFDTGVIAIFNNSNRDLQYYISSGLSLQYLF